VILTLIPIVVLAVTPWHNLEPVTLPKSFALTLITSLGICFQLFSKRVITIRFDAFSIALGLGFLGLLLSLSKNSQFLSERIFGVSGRNTGALFLTCILILLLLAKKLNIGSLPWLVIVIKFASLSVALYFIIQKIGFDKAQWIDAYGGVPSSTLGNPNFVSSLVGIGTSITLPYLLFRKTKIPIRCLLLLFLFIEVYVLFESNSAQGALILAFSILLIFSIKLRKALFSRFDKLTKFLKLLSVSLFTLLVLILVFFRDLWEIPASYMARLDYWYAAVGMIVDSPLTGQGLDYFGESYFKFRGQDAADRAPGLFSDSAHNYFLDFGAFGGLPLLLSFFIPFSIVLLRSLRISFFLNQKSVEKDSLDLATLGCILAWWGFFLQSLISPISHGLIVIGVILTGALYSALPSNPNKTKNLELWKKIKSRLIFRFQLEFSKIPSLFMKFAGLALAISLPILGAQPIITDARFRDAIEQGNGDSILRISITEPKNFSRMETASDIFLQNNYPDLALKVIRIMVQENPGNIRGWRLLNTNPNSTQDERLKARANILSLDPYNTQLKKELAQLP
jgi:O-antigen ligase